MQIELSAALADRLDPALVWWSAIDGSWAPSPWVGQVRRLRGCKGGVPDVLVLHRGRLTCVELKTPKGRISDNQRGQRAELVRAGARWYLCRSIPAVLRALRLSRVPMKQVAPDPYAFDPSVLDHHPQSDPTAPRKRGKPRKLTSQDGLAYFRAMGTVGTR
ncbi:MAG: VRR-NUC domain-containing protein [Acetobacteraceae bacterium]